MSVPIHRLLVATITILPLVGCQPADPEQPPTPSVKAVDRGSVTDLVAFEAFIANRPTPAQFRQRYPDVLLVLPGDIATFELRGDNSRYFAELDDARRISGGRFQ